MEEYVKMLGFIQRTTKELQKKGITLAKAQFYLDHLTDWVAEGRDAMAASNHWARCCQIGSYMLRWSLRTYCLHQS
jgi:hypothetical protein